MVKYLTYDKNLIEGMDFYKKNRLQIEAKGMYDFFHDRGIFINIVFHKQSAKNFHMIGYNFEIKYRVEKTDMDTWKVAEYHDKNVYSTEEKVGTMAVLKGFEIMMKKGKEK